MRRAPVSSESLRSIGYDTDTKELEVEFHNTGVYRYHHVPLFAYERLMRAESLGRHFNEHIKDRYPHTKVS